MTLGVHRLFNRRLAAWWTLVAGLALTAVLGWELHRQAVALDKQRLQRRTVDIQNQLDSRMEKSELLLNNLRDFLRFSGETRETILDRWCYDNGLTINCPWIHGIVVATNRHIPQWRADFPKPPGSWNNEDWNKLNETVAKQPIDCEIALGISATNSMRFLKDYQLQAFRHQRDQFGIAVQSSRPGMSEKRTVTLDVHKNRVSGTLFYVPIYSADMAPVIAENAAAGRNNWGHRATMHWLHFRSMIVAPVNYDTLLDAMHGDAPRDVEIELFASVDQTATTWLSNSKTPPHAADPAFKAYLTDRQIWRMYGQKFSIFFYTTPLFEAQSPRRLAKVAVCSGVILTLLAAVLVGVALSARDQQERLVLQIRDARDALATAQAERSKMSRDLHDGTIQSLYAIQLGLGHTVENLKADPFRAGRGLSAVQRELDTVIAEIRQFITAEAEADPSADLSSVLRALRERAAAGTTAQIELECDDAADRRLTGNRAVQLANIAREALSNSLRHGAPRRVQIFLRSEPESVVLQITDDGVGFNLHAPPRVGVGLSSMASRAQEMSGKLEIQTAPAQGTSVTVRVPAPPEPDGCSDSSAGKTEDDI